ncbi:MULTISPECIES: Hsp20/alpha crystallin family protein [unclassified Actinobaculum]|uniref:Hsp20/alpha crystallin family protein n=1 Tax=unclassified Actinobaculum TaxID=2609299 RepID=UPI000D5269EA|nr:MULTISPECIES: Hsp20/alpha crystallin family protein [unclassified Actinobaculum]AWE42829.1 heat-shock protein Hsp20 [Actinobaculum sp. 313]RTE47854.1 Hsp20/alpha crystallin family protein [Actinobaculum sp. 352]
MATFSTDPFRELERIMTGAMRNPGSTAMPMDLYRKGDTFVAQIDLPGVDPSTIDIDIDDRTLTVRAERKADADADLKWLSRERPAGTFARQLTLGYGLALDKISADYRDGVLTLTLPVSEESKPRKVTVSHSNGGHVIDAGTAE